MIVINSDDDSPQKALMPPTGHKRPVKALANKPKKAKKDVPHVLLWVPHNGTRGMCGDNEWCGLEVIGVYKSKEAAELKREELLEEHDQCGEGDILVGDTWEDEVDLVVKPCELFLDE